MNRKVILILVVLGLLAIVGVSTISAQGKTHKVDMTFTGEIILITDEIGLFDIDLKGSPGPANSRGLAFSYPVDYSELPAGNQCSDIPGSPDGLILTTDGQFNMVFQDGSMLFGSAVDGGYVCFASGFGYAPYELVGGTGRFEGASGDFNTYINSFIFGGPEGRVIPETGTATGEIVLP